MVRRRTRADNLELSLEERFIEFSALRDYTTRARLTIKRAQNLCKDIQAAHKNLEPGYVMRLAKKFKVNHSTVIYYRRLLKIPSLRSKEMQLKQKLKRLI